MLPFLWMYMCICMTYHDIRFGVFGVHHRKCQSAADILCCWSLRTVSVVLMICPRVAVLSHVITLTRKAMRKNGLLLETAAICWWGEVKGEALRVTGNKLTPAQWNNYLCQCLSNHEQTDQCETFLLRRASISPSQLIQKQQRSDCVVLSSGCVQTERKCGAFDPTKKASSHPLLPFSLFANSRPPSFFLFPSTCN